MKKNILITGSCGFIGFHLCKKLLESNFKIFGIDNMEGHYEYSLKYNRLKLLKEYNNFEFYNFNIEKITEIEQIFINNKIDIVINLAGRPGVRLSNKYKKEYIETNILGFFNILELSSKYKIKHLIFPSSSSIYGDSVDIPYKEETNTDYPISIYAATKKCDEVLAYTYSKLNNLNITILRLFTVYGPYGRPDMGYYKFVKMIMNNEKIELYNNGDIKRDFTYIDDVVEAFYRIIMSKPLEKYNVYNIGNEHPVLIKDVIITLSKEMKTENLISDDYNIYDYLENHEEILEGDVYETYSDTSKFYKDFNYKPKTNIEKGLKSFIKWYKEYYNK